MGRRALRPVDPALELAGYFHRLEDLSPPFVAEAFFPRPAPLEIEVGSGKGLFMASASREHPERNFLGIEIAYRYARYCAARLARLQVQNACMIAGDAQRFFTEFLAEGTIAAVHVYFPDPWWKKRHHKRRIMNPAFVKQIERVLHAGGRLHFWTDVEEYYELAAETLRNETNLRGPLAVEERPAEHELDYRTHFERRTRMHELPVYRAEYVK